MKPNRTHLAAMVMQSRPANNINVEIGKGFGLVMPNMRVKTASFATEAVTLTADVAANRGQRGSEPFRTHTTKNKRREATFDMLCST